MQENKYDKVCLVACNSTGLPRSSSARARVCVGVSVCVRACVWSGATRRHVHARAISVVRALNGVCCHACGCRADPKDNSFDITSMKVPAGNGKWWGGVKAKDGRIFGIPAAMEVRACVSHANHRDEPMHASPLSLSLSLSLSLAFAFAPSPSPLLSLSRALFFSNTPSPHPHYCVPLSCRAGGADHQPCQEHRGLDLSHGQAAPRPVTRGCAVPAYVLDVLNI